MLFSVGSLAAFGSILYISMIRSASSKLVDPDEQGKIKYDKYVNKCVHTVSDLGFVRAQGMLQFNFLFHLHAVFEIIDQVVSWYP